MYPTCSEMLIYLDYCAFHRCHVMNCYLGKVLKYGACYCHKHTCQAINCVDRVCGYQTNYCVKHLILYSNHNSDNHLTINNKPETQSKSTPNLNVNLPNIYAKVSN